MGRTELPFLCLGCAVPRELKHWEQLKAAVPKSQGSRRAKGSASCVHRENGIMPVPREKFITFRADKGEESVGEPLRM